MRAGHSWLIAVLVAAVVGGGGCAASRQAQRPDKAVPETIMEDPFNPDRPPTAKTLYLMADILVAQGRDAQAEQLYKKIQTEYPEFLPAYNDLAAMQMRQRRIPDAMQTLSAGLSVSPRDPVLLNNMGMCWLIRKDYAKSLDYFTEAAAVIPDNTRYRSNMATALSLMGRRDEALMLFRQILPEEEAMENVRLLCDRAGAMAP
ncbi:MAG: tetratricopeptide repeat protein [Planctomycetales bacterium]|nr:tetratricopeptide repeat protein [Planctomycetales bacterium]